MIMYLPDSLNHFNSRPHGGRRFLHLSTAVLRNISTHALTEGDQGQFQLYLRSQISTHALTEGDSS